MGQPGTPKRKKLFGRGALHRCAVGVVLLFSLLIGVPLGIVVISVIRTYTTPVTPERLTGTWALSGHDGVRGEMVIRPDGTCSQTVVQTNHRPVEARGRWNIGFHGLVVFSPFIVPRPTSYTDQIWVAEKNVVVSPAYWGCKYEMAICEGRYRYVKTQGWHPSHARGN